MRDLVMLMICGTIVSLFQNVNSSPTVQINNGQIIGQRVSFSGHEVNQYLGIPYAQPPIGQLRFKKPIPFQNYTPSFTADNNPPSCPQYSDQPSLVFYLEPVNKSEDCLYLNIWTPEDASPTNKKAVFYYVYGGDFRIGSIRSELYSGIALSSLGDIIVVNVNYRVGPFGFLTSGTEDAPPNVGLWDILEGLKWVNQNIESFGGDLSRITLAGESAGAIAVGLLTVSPLAKGLYTRQIMQSGSPFTRLTDNRTRNIDLAQELAERVGCANDTYSIKMHPKEVVQCMREVDMDTLSRREFDIDPHMTFLFVPQWGDDLLPQNPRVAVKEGHFRCKDLLIGNNKDEGSLLLTAEDPEMYGFFGKKNPPINKTLGQNTIQKSVNSFPDPQSIVQYYLPDNSSPGYKRIRHQAYTVKGDTVFLCPDVYYGEKCAEQGQNVYFYFFTHRPSVTRFAKWMGVTHFQDVYFVFGQPVFNPKKYQPSEVTLSEQMIDIWTQFVKYGKPNIPWPLYSRENPTFKYLGPNIVSGKNGVGPHLKNCNFLRPFF